MMSSGSLLRIDTCFHRASPRPPPHQARYQLKRLLEIHYMLIQNNTLQES